ncbi:unnamed protein product [Larinioides sclopetarius]|uniref:Uncharacterized protein n=1 Tax=Larinioides sclopetarius TaxID=280406 RepID=A0AAV2A6W5_9ARAC
MGRRVVLHLNIQLSKLPKKLLIEPCQIVSIGGNKFCIQFEKIRSDNTSSLSLTAR